MAHGELSALHFPHLLHLPHLPAPIPPHPLQKKTKPHPRLTSTVQVPICGNSITLGFPTSPLWIFGSSSYTSSPTDAISPASSAATSAASSMTAPRAVLMMMDEGFICKNWGVERRWCVECCEGGGGVVSVGRGGEGGRRLRNGGVLEITDDEHSAANSHSAHPPPPATPPNPPTSHRPPPPQAAYGGYGTRRAFPAPKPCARGSARCHPCPGCRAPCPPGRGLAREGDRRARRRCGGRAWRR